MLKKISFCIVIASLAAVSAANAQEPRDFTQLPVQTVQLPGTDYKIVFNSPELQAGEPRALHPLSVAIASWLKANFGFPAMRNLPRVEYASPIDIATLRSRHLLSSTEGGLIPAKTNPPGQRDFPTFYSDRSKVIYLPEGWNGSTPTELSIFVREIVHHLQNEAGFTYEFTQLREESAFAAQNRWLAMFSHLVQNVNATSADCSMQRTQCASQ